MSFRVTLHLRLDKPAEYIYRPGDLVSGVAWLRSNIDENVKSVSIILKGWSTVRFLDYRGKGGGGPRKFREDYNLFIIPQVLVQGPRKFKKFEVHEWPFEFIFPDLTELNFSGQEMGEGADRFELSPHHLPPSVPFDQAVCGGVIYELEATLQNCGKGGKLRSRSENLTFKPQEDFTEVDHVEHREVGFVSSRLPTRTAGQKFRGIFSWDESNRPFTVNFTVHVEVPHDIFLGQLVPVSVRVQHNREESTQIAEPLFHLHTARIFLVTVTATRLLNLEKFPKGHWFRESKQSRLLDVGHYVKCDLKLDTSLDLRRILKAKVEDVLLPFRSYSVTRFYMLKIVLVVKCEGDRAEFTVDVEVPISLLPSLSLVQSRGELGSPSTTEGVSRRPTDLILSSHSEPVPVEDGGDELPGYAP